MRILRRKWVHILKQNSGILQKHSFAVVLIRHIRLRNVLKHNIWSTCSSGLGSSNQRNKTPFITAHFCNKMIDC